ncbi:MAG: saccharopine dehydrogenase NADP-binding domain-containing protein, partial [Bacteroidota bacterium]
REYEVVVLGASGFTGKLVAEYLLKNYGRGESLKWAIAGRNVEKLEKIRKELGDEEIPILQADNMKPESIQALAQKTKVICTTVGPYAKYGDSVVEACVQAGTYYCDLTGEVPWIRRMIDQHHEPAQKKQVKIVHCCGFDSIPADMGVYFIQKTAQEKEGKYCRHIKLGLKGASGGLSGGTYASLSNVMAEAEEDKSIYKLLANPYGLNPDDYQEGKDARDLRAVVYDFDFKNWVSPFVMAAINTRIVRRSHALRDLPYGPDFQYDEFVLSGSGPGGWVKGVVSSLPLAVVAMAKPGGFLKGMVDRFMPKPGEGPNENKREKGFFKFKFVGLMEDGTSVTGNISGDRDPGYGSTSKMLGECAVCLAKDKLTDIYGVITPSTAMGDAILQRLEARAGLSFEWKS